MLSRRIAIISLLIILIFCYVKYRDDLFENSLNNYIGDNNAVYIGKILDYEKKNDYTYMYKFRIKSINDKKVNILINLYTKKEYCYGDILVLNMKIEKPVENRNPGGFNNKLYLFSKGIYGIGYLEKELYAYKSDNSIFSYINNSKQKIINKILNRYDEKSASILISMILGDNKYLSNETKNIFSNSNLSHLLSVSGTHLVFFLAIISYILYKLNIKYKVKNMLLIFFVIFYLVITGFRVSIIRATIMYVFSTICIIKDSNRIRKINKITILMIILLLLLLYNPFNLFNISVILSFSAVLGIMLFSQMINYKLQYNLNKQSNSKLKKITNMSSITISVQIVLIPIISIYFNKIYILAVFANIIGVPISNACLLFGIMFSIISDIPFISNIFVLINTICIKLLTFTADYFSKLPLSRIIVFPFRWYEVIIYYLIIYNFFVSNKISYIVKNNVKRIYNFLKEFWKEKLYKKTRVLLIIYVLIVCMLIIYVRKNTLIINFIDVGQGDSTLIRCYGKTILIDGGGSESDGFDVGEKVLLPYLLHERINKIDYVIISHFDNDHIKGLIQVINNIKVDKIVYASKTFKTEEFNYFIKKIYNKNKHLYEVNEYDRIKICKKLSIDILAPIDNINVTESTSNNTSLVCKLTYINTKILFTGDIEKETENILIKKDISADILKIGHHGSKTSTNIEFLNKVNPKLAVICVGKNNFGHPSNDVLNRLKEKQIDTYRTDLNGMITVKINLNENIKINKQIN